MWSSKPPMAGTGRLTSSKSAGPPSTSPIHSATTGDTAGVKNDERDATDLVDLLRMGRLAEAWIAPPPLRELRELIRYRAKLVQLRANLKSQVHSVLAKEGVTVPMSDLFGVGGQRLFDEVALAHAYRVRVESLLDLLEICDREVDMLEKEVAPTSPATSATRPSWPYPASARCWPPSSWPRSVTSRGSRAPGTCAAGPGSPPPTTSPTRRSVEVTSPSRVLASCAGPPSRRWPTSAAPPRGRHHHRVAERRGNKIGRVAAARKLLTLVYYGLRDGEIRCLAQTRVRPGTDATRCELGAFHGSRSAARPRI